ncbi:unnamed protein product [Lota lota]
MDGTSSSTASSLLTQGDDDQPLPEAWAFPSARCLPVFSSDQVWLEELVGSLSHGLPSSPSQSACSSPGASMVGSEFSDSVDSWSSGTTGLLHSSVERQSRQDFQAHLTGGVGGWDERAALTPARFLDGTIRRVNRQGEAGLRDEGTDEGSMCQGRGCPEDQSRAGNTKPLRWKQLEQKIGAKLKFSRFLDEVTCSVLDPNSLQAFGQPISLLSKRERGLHPRLTTTSTATRTTAAPPEDTAGSLSQSSPGFACPLAQHQQGPLLPTEKMQDERVLAEPVGKSYLETDIHHIRGQDGLSGHRAKTEMSYGLAIIEEDKVIQPPSVLRKDGGLKGKSTFPKVPLGSAFSRNPCRSVSLPRGINLVPDEEMNNVEAISSLLEQKEDLRKRLSFTTHKLELLESEFDSTRQYLETELRRAQEELDKFTDKLRRIQSSYSALQRINQDLEEKIHRNTQHHDDEKRALSREIIVLNNHLIEAKLTIEKLQEDNELYRKDCNLAAQLLQCNKSVYRAQLSELPADLQQRVTLHLEESPLCHPSYADSVPGSIIAEVLEKADEACSSSQASHSPSPPPQDHGFLMDTMGRVDRPRSGQVLGLGFGLRAAYKTDLYSSDTALYCPDDRHRERRPSMDLHGQRKLLYGPQNSMDSNPEEAPVALRPGFSQEHFGGKFPGSSSYSSFSGAGSEDKGNGPPSSGGSSPHHHSLYMEWRDAGDYERKSNSSWERDSPGGFSIGAHPFQQAELSHHQHQHQHHHHHQNGSSPVYSRTMSSCFSEPYEPLPPSSSPSVAYGDSRRGSALAPGEEEEEEEEEEELIGRWRQLSGEDLSAHTYRSPGRASPYSFSEQHFSVRPSKIRLGPLYSSFQEGADYYPHQGAADSVWGGGSPSSERGPGMMGRQCHSAQAHLYRAKEDSQESENSLYHSGSSKDLEGSVAGAGAAAGEEYAPASPNSSSESLNQGGTLEMQAAELQHYQVEMQHNLPPQGSQASPPPPPPPPPYSQNVGTLGLSRKDSLTKAQLYGTLLN